MQKINPMLWFDNQASEAAEFYTSVFKDAKITGTSDLIVTMELFGQKFQLLNGGKQEWAFTDAISFVISCDDQNEVDYYWDGLMVNGGHPEQCGWLRDQYGVAWQVVPTAVERFMASTDTVKSKAAFDSLMQMVKIDIATLQKAYDEA